MAEDKQRLFMVVAGSAATFREWVADDNGGRGYTRHQAQRVRRRFRELETSAVEYYVEFLDCEVRS